MRTRKISLKKLLATLSVVALSLLSLPAVAQEAGKGDVPSVDKIVQKSNRVAYYQGKDGRAELEMTIVDPQGRERQRKFKMLRWDEPNPDKEEAEKNPDQYTGGQRFYTYFTRPADVDGMVYMVWKHVEAGTPDDRWLYLPALDLVKRIAATDERTSFVGSHFLYEDVSGRNITEDTHELVDVTDNYYVLKNVPKKPDRVEFAHYMMYIHKDTFLPIQSVYYDDQGEKYRKYEVLKVEKIEGYVTATKTKMTDLRTGGYTVIDYNNVEYNVDLPKDIFTKRYLRQPPRQHLR